MVKKIYCYVDETGQDTQGKFFISVVVIVGVDRDEIRERLKKIEFKSGKGIKKWTKSTREQRKAYIEGLLHLSALQGKIFFTRFINTTHYLPCVLQSIAWAITGIMRKEQYQATVLIDGLRREEQHKMGRGLRELNLHIRKVKGLKDESDEFIRLADAIAGFVRDCLEKHVYLQELYERLKRQGIINEEHKTSPNKNPRG